MTVHANNMDLGIVVAFFLITLVIGLRSGKGIKSVREYIVANKSFGTMALVLTYLAMNMSGTNVFDFTDVIFDDGVIATVALLVLMFNFLFRALFVAPHAAKFPACLTMGDLVGTLYGPTSKIIAGFLGLFITFCIATMELSMLGKVGQSLLGWHSQGTIVLGGILLALYTAHGGIRSVTTADGFQFLVLLIGIPILAIITVEEAGGMKAIFEHVPQERLQIWDHPRFTYYLTHIFIWIIPLGMVDPCEMQRMLMGRSGKQLRNQFLIISVFDPSLQLTLMLIGLAGVVLYPHIEGLQLIPHIVHHLLPEGLKGLVMAGLFGIVTSTIDSYLHAMGVTAVHDILQPVLGNRLKEAAEIRYTRYATVLLSLGAIYAALHTQNFLGFLVLSLELAGPLLMFPIIAGMMGLKPDKKVFYGATGVTLVAYLIAKLKLPVEQEHFVALVSVLANGVSFFGFYRLRHKGFVTVQEAQATTHLYRPQRKTFRERLSDSIPTPRRIIEYSQKQVEKYGAPYALLGVFCCINYTFPYFMWKHEATAMYTTMLYLRVLGAVLCGLLIVKDKWPASLLPYLPTYWHLTLLYCLPFTSTVMFLLTQGSIEWLINVALTIMFLIVLVDWLSFVVLTMIGIALGSLFYTLAIGPIQLQLDFSTGYLLMYTCIFSTLIALLFAGRREQHLEAKLREISDHHHANKLMVADVYPAVCRIVTMIEQQVQEFSNNYQQQAEAPMQLTSQGELLTTPDCLLYLFPTALEIIKQGADMDHHIVQELKQAHVDPQANLLSLRTCVTSILGNYEVLDQQYVAIDSASKDYPIYASFTHLQYALIHVLRFIHACDLDTGISLKITQSEGIHIRLNGTSLPYASIQQLFSLFPAQTSAKHPGLAISRLLIEAHDGQLLCKTHTAGQSLHTEFILFIPPAEVGTREHSSPT